MSNEIEQKMPPDYERAFDKASANMAKKIDAEIVQTLIEQAKPTSIQGKLRVACDHEDFGVPAQYAKRAHNYAMWLISQQAKPTAIALTDADIDLIANAHSKTLRGWEWSGDIIEVNGFDEYEFARAIERHLTAPHGESDKTAGA